MTKFKAVFAAVLVFAVTASAVTTNAATRYELESQYHGNTPTR